MNFFKSTFSNKNSLKDQKQHFMTINPLSQNSNLNAVPNSTVKIKAKPTKKKIKPEKEPAEK